MAKIDLTDAEIQALITEPKELPPHYDKRFRLRPRHGHSKAQLDITTKTGRRFRFILRQSHFNTLDFSAILGSYLSEAGRFLFCGVITGSRTSTPIRSKGRPSTTSIYASRPSGIRPRVLMRKKYAVPTVRYATLRQAFECLMSDCNVREQKPEGDKRHGLSE